MTKPEPLKGKKTYFNEIEQGGNWDVVEGFYKDDVKSSVEFYKKYRNIPSALEYDYPKLKPQLEEYFNLEHTKVTRKEDYNDWLLDYCFGDVIDA